MYGVAASVCIAQNYDEGPVQAKRIHEEHNISTVYLYRILGLLVRANILQSKKGPTGGFRLARPARDISLLEIWEAIDGPLKNRLDLAELTKNEPFSLNIEKLCYQATDKARATLDKTKLSTLIR